MPSIIPICQCEPHDQDAGGGYVEHLLEYNPECPVHSYHILLPREGVWALSQAPHEMILLQGEIEVCNICRNINGEHVAWDQTWHAIRKDMSRQVQHAWEQLDPDSDHLTAMCGDPEAKQFNFYSAEESRAVPCCRVCHSKAVAKARREEWDKVTSEGAINIFKTGWHMARRLGKPKTAFALGRIRQLLGR